MGYRAPSSGVSLTVTDAAIAKAMLARGDRQHDIAAWFGVNGGRITELATGKSFSWVPPAQVDNRLPPPGPYPGGREATAALDALATAEAALETARRVVLRRRVP
ncbi:MAG TPA: hypothetical protein VGA98_00145 [Allosphingosinicella sp.]|jgi:hypothetical protein